MRSGCCKSENVSGESPRGIGGESSTVQKCADEGNPKGDKYGGARGRGDGERGRSNPAASKNRSFATGRADTPPQGDEARGSYFSKEGPHQPADRTYDVPKGTSSSVKLHSMESRSAVGGSVEDAGDVSETASSTGRIGGGMSRDARNGQTGVSNEVEDGGRAERPAATGKRRVQGPKARNTAAAVSETSNACVDGAGGSVGGKSSGDDSSHTSVGSGWTSRTGDLRLSSEQCSAASTGAGSPSEKSRVADIMEVEGSSSGSAGRRRRRRSRSRSKSNLVVADVAGGVGGREGDQISDHHQPKMVAVSKP